MEKQVFDKLFKMSEAHYLPSGYHTQEHRARVVENARALGSLVLRNGHQYDPMVLDLSSAWHDAGLALDPTNTSVNTPQYTTHPDYPRGSNERLSAELFAVEASKLSVPEPLERQVFRTILGTNPEMPINHVEAKILAAADIASVGFGSYQEFYNNTFLLWQEAVMKSGEQVDWQKFVAGSMNYLGKFTARKIHLTSAYFNEEGNSAWHSGAVNNMLQLVRETWPKVDVFSSINEDRELAQGNEEINIIASSEDGEKYEMLVKVPLESSPLIEQLV